MVDPVMNRTIRPATDEHAPWYRQFWPWFLIALPATSVIGGIATVFVAASHPQAMVVDDYARIGLATHQMFERDRKAAELGLSAQLSVTAEPADIRVRLDGATSLPDHLVLRLFHPTRADADRKLLLPGFGEGYSARLETPLTGRWYVQIEPPDAEWRLAGERLSGEQTMVLAPPPGAIMRDRDP
jgi:hypothetical protein